MVTALAFLASAVKTALHLTPGCRLQSLRSFRPTLGPSHRLLRGANGAPALRVRQPETLCERQSKMRKRERPFLAAKTGWLSETDPNPMSAPTCRYIGFIIWGACILNFHYSYAQPSPLPLGVGNYWVFETVLGDQRSVSGRIEVHDKVRVRSVVTDTSWHGADQAFGADGDEYYKLSVTGNVRLFPISQPDTLLVRVDQQGNIWSRGYILRNTIRVTRQEQPWLLAEGAWTWNFKLDEEEFAVGYRRELWIGQNEELSHTQSELWVYSYPDSGSLSGGGEKFVAMARRFIPKLSPSSPNKLINISGRNNGMVATSLGGTDVMVLTGIGPIWIPLPTDMTELQGIHLELNEARLGDVVLRPSNTTIVQPVSFGWLKTSFR